MNLIVYGILDHHRQKELEVKCQIFSIGFHQILPIMLGDNGTKQKTEEHPMLSPQPEVQGHGPLISEGGKKKSEKHFRHSGFQTA